MFDILGIRSHLCPYSNMFGEPKKGVHRHRIFGMATVDLALTLVFIVWFVWYTKIDWWKVTVGVFVAMVVFHWLFCVKTTINKALLGDLA